MTAKKAHRKRKLEYNIASAFFSFLSYLSFEDELNILEQWSISTTYNSELNGGIAVDTATHLRNPRNRQCWEVRLPALPYHLHWQMRNIQKALGRCSEKSNRLLLMLFRTLQTPGRLAKLSPILPCSNLEKLLDKLQWSSGFWGRKRESYAGRRKL